jgi:ribosomal protein S12
VTAALAQNILSSSQYQLWAGWGGFRRRLVGKKQTPALENAPPEKGIVVTQIAC